jgi:hypothetical protein
VRNVAAVDEQYVLREDPWTLVREF